MLVWHVDDLNVSHMDIFEITKFVRYLWSIYGGLTVPWGKVYDYLGMELNHIKKATVKLYTIKYLYSVLKELQYHLDMAATTPAADHLFMVRDEGTPQYLPENQAQTFHHALLKLVLMSDRACQAIHMAV